MARRYNYHPTTSKKELRTGLLIKRTDDYRRMVAAIDVLKDKGSFTTAEYNEIREGHRRTYCTLDTLRDNGIVVVDSQEWVNGTFVQSASNRSIACYSDNNGRTITYKRYQVLCEIYGTDYVSDVLNFTLKGYYDYIPGHYATTYKIDKEVAKQVRALLQSFATICEEIL